MFHYPFLIFLVKFATFSFPPLDFGTLKKISLSSDISSGIPEKVPVGNRLFRHALQFRPAVAGKPGYSNTTHTKCPGKYLEQPPANRRIPTEKAPET